MSFEERGRQKLPVHCCSKYDSVTARLHFMFGNLSRLDDSLSTADNKMYCNWFCKDNIHSTSAQPAALWSLLLSQVLRDQEGMGSYQ